MRRLLLLLLFIASLPGLASASLGADAGLSLVLSPNITNFITNNYTTNNYTYSGGFAPASPWLYNDTSNMYFNYSRLIFEFYNKTDTDALLNAQDECSEISGCVVGAITSSYNSTYAATTADVAANKSAWLTNCYNASYLTSYSEADPLWSGNATAALSTYNATYHATSQDVTANRTAWFSTYNASYLTAETDPRWQGNWSGYNKANWDTAYGWGNHSAAGYLKSYTETDPLWSGNATAALSIYNATYHIKQNDIGSNCVTDNYAYGVQDDGTLLCRADQVGGGGTGAPHWVDGGEYLYPNTSYADNIFIMGWIKSYNWTNVTITEAQITDLGSYWSSCDDSDTCGYLTSYAETDPLWSGNASAALSTYNATYHATSADVTANRSAWFSTYNASYLTSYTETDPRWSANYTACTSAQKLYFNGFSLACNIDSAYNASYLTSYTETDPKWAANYTACASTSKLYFNGYSLACNIDSAYNASYLTSTYNTTYATSSADVTANRTSFLSVYNASYLTAESDPKWSGNYTACSSSQKLYFNGYSLACNGDSAYNASYLTTETDPLWSGNSTAALNQTANAVECTSSCISDAEVVDDLTIISSANISTALNVRINQSARICLNGATCSKYIFYNGTDVVIQG